MTLEGHPTPAHRAQFAGFRVVTWLLGRLPERAAQLLAAGLGWLAGSVLRIRRGVVDQNLLRAFPDRAARWRGRVARASYVHLAREAVSTFRLPGEADRIRGRVRFQGLDELREAVEGGSGALILSGHLGNWELGGSVTALQGVPLDVVVARQKNPLFHRELVRTRGQLGLGVILRRDATRAILRALRAGRSVALAADQNVWSGEVWVDFFGIPAATTRGPALLAIRTGAPLFLALAYREPGWLPRYRVVFQRLSVRSTGDLDADVARITRSYLAALEEAVRSAPAQYFWHHRRWKRSPEPSAGTGTAPAGHGTSLP